MRSSDCLVTVYLQKKVEKLLPTIRLHGSRLVKVGLGLVCTNECVESIEHLDSMANMLAHEVKAHGWPVGSFNIRVHTYGSLTADPTFANQTGISIWPRRGLLR